MQMQKRKFRIGDLAQKLKIDKFVIRFWEKEFALNSGRSNGGQRFYEEKDFETFQQIKTLLYDQKFTIAGAKKQLIDLNLNSDTNNNIIASQKTNIKNQDYNNLNKQKTIVTQIAFGSQDHQDSQNTKFNKQNVNYYSSKTQKNHDQNAKLRPKTLKKIIDLKQNLIKLRELLD